MKKFLIIFYLFISYSVYSQSGWTLQSPYPTKNILTKIEFFNSSTGYTVGYLGTILKTTNGGINWINQYPSTSTYLWNMHFINEFTGFVIGSNGLINKTTNSGNNWFNITSGTNYNLWGISFINTLTGYISGDKGTLLKTTNTGANWTISKIDTSYGFNSINFINYQTAIALTLQGKIFKTTNAGNNWVQAYSSFQYTWRSSFFINEQTGFVSGGYYSGAILKTTNSGDNWELQVYNNTRVLNDIVFVNETTGFCVSESRYVLKTTNSGQSWFENAHLPYIDAGQSDLTSIDIKDSVCYISGYSGQLYKSTNLGGNWNTLFSGIRSGLYSIHVFDSNKVIAVGGGGMYAGIAKTTNGGNYWYQIFPGFNAELYTLFFVNAEIGFTGGMNGYLSKTTNAGDNWYRIATNFTNTINSIYFTNNENGFLTARDGIYKTTNAGDNWDMKFSYNEYLAIQFVSSNIGYAVGTEGAIAKTTNAGNNWISNTLPGSDDLLNLAFINETSGYVTSLYGPIIKTTNGGLNWNISYNTNNTYSTIYFLNQNTGFAAGSEILKTTNAGNNWNVINYGYNAWIMDIQFVNDYTGYFCGGDGVILKTTNTGESIGILTINTNIPTSTRILNNYPNPFNSTTKIRFEISSNNVSDKKDIKNVKLEIYDIQGRLIDLLVNEDLQSGIYEIEWNATSYPSGVYFCVLRYRNNSYSNKIILLK